jgi:peptidoglycan hydrolase-like protein with peptidoglycan-binding domain
MCVLMPASDAVAKRSFGSRTLRMPMKGADVRVLQQLLTEWGLETAADGRFGPATRRQVLLWEDYNDVARINGRMGRREAVILRTSVDRGEHAPGFEPEESAVSGSVPAPTAPGEAATVGPDGLAIAPESAPDVVKAIIAAGNQIHDLPYKYGGGHGRWVDSGYDCSGSMSFALHGAGLLDVALDSTGFMSWGEAGPGQWVTIYGNPGHSYMVVAGVRFDTSGRASVNTRWHEDMRSARGYTVRHPAGL